MNHFQFFTESIKNLKTTGTLVQSSRFLCQKMSEQIPVRSDAVVIELGAGDGRITKHILNRLGKNGRLFSFEINEQFCEQLRKIKDPRFHLMPYSAENLISEMHAHGISEVNYVISALPFVVLPPELATSIIKNARDILSPDGLYVQMHYNMMEKKRYLKVFGNCEMHFVPINIPPAWVLVCQKR